MMLKNNLFFLTIFIAFSCCKQNKTEITEHKEKNSLVSEIYKIVDSVVDSLPRPYDDRLYTVTHQKKNGKDFLKISTAEYFNRDSVSTYKIYRDRLIVFYAKDFFEKHLDKLDTVGLQHYNSLIYDENILSMYHPRYEVIEIFGNDKFRVLPLQEHHQKKLFYFSDVPEMPEPVPNDSIK